MPHVQVPVTVAFNALSRICLDQGRPCVNLALSIKIPISGLVEALAIFQQHHDPESGLSVRFEEPAVTPEPAPTPGPAEASVQCPVRTKAASANAGTNAGPANASPDPCISVPTPGPAEAAPAESTPPRPMPAPTPFK